MNFKFFLVCSFAFLIAANGFSQDIFETKDAKPAGAPDKERLSYAIGMNLALQLKQSGTKVDAELIAQAINDVMAGRPTQLQESEIRPLFYQAQAYQLAKKSESNQIAGATFLTNNAKAAGVIVLPDGVQYRVLQPGAGQVVKETDFLVLNYRGKWIDGAEFRHTDQFHIPFRSCPKAWKEVLSLLKVGSKVEIAVPSAIAYGAQPGRAAGFGSTLLYNLEILSADAKPSTTEGQQYGGGRMGHAPGEEFLPSTTPAK